MAIKNYTPFLFCIVSTCAFAQTSKGNFTGTVVLGNSPVIAAHVVLNPSSRSALTNASGQFHFKSVSFGTYELVVSFVGAKQLVQKVNIDKSTVALEFQLSEDLQFLDAVTVKGKSKTTELKEDALQIESIGMKDVINRVKDVSEAIERLPGVNIRGSGSFGDRVDITINGLNGTAVRTYIDGMPLEFVFPAFTIANVPVDNIDRVDVYKGAVPINVSSDALGGAVNIVTKKQYPNQMKASYGYGSFNTHQANLIGAYKINDNVAVNANVTYNLSDNNFTMEAFEWESQERKQVTRFHDAYRLFFVNTNLDINNVKWADYFRLSLTHNDFVKEIQNGGQISNFAFGHCSYTGNATAYTATYEKRFFDSVDLETVFNYSQNNIVFVDTTANLYSWSGKIIERQEAQRGELDNNALTDRNFNNFVHRFNLRWAISNRDEILLSNLLAQQTTKGLDKTKSPERDALRRNQILRKNTLGLHYQRKLFKDKLLASLGGKFYYYDIDGVESMSFQNVFTAGRRTGYFASFKYSFTNDLFIRSSYEQALRIPVFGQFFGDGASIGSNVQLKPETSNNVNLGMSYQNRSLDNFKYGLRVNSFYRYQKDIIYLTNEEFQRYRNSEEILTLGVEGELSFELWKHWTLEYNITGLSQNYAAVDNENSFAQFLVGRPFPNIPKFFMNFSLRYNAQNWLGYKDKIRFYLQYKYVDEFNFINVGAVYDPDNFVPAQNRVDGGKYLAGLTAPSVQFNGYYSISGSTATKQFNITKVGIAGQFYAITK